MRGLACQKNVTEKPLHRVVANRTIDTETRSTALLKPERKTLNVCANTFPGSIPPLTLMLIASKPLCGDTISADYQFTGSAKNLVIANGFITSDGVATGSVNGLSEVAFDTHNKVNLSTLQNYGTFTMVFPNGDTAFGNLHEDDTKVSLMTFSGPFTQTLNFSGGTGEFEDVSGTLTGGGFIYPTYYTTSGAGTLTGPGLVASPEPGSGVLLAMGLSIALFKVLRMKRVR